MAVDAASNVYVCDQENTRLRRISAAGIISTVAGSGMFRRSPENSPAVRAFFFRPQGLALDTAGNVIVADTESHQVRRTTPQGLISTAAGSGVRASGPENVAAVTATLRNPSGLALDSRGNLYIADRDSHRIRQVTPGGVMRTIAGTSAMNGFAGDGGPATAARLNLPHGIAVDAAGNLFIADHFNHRIRRVDVAGIITTIAGSGQAGFAGDRGPALQALLNLPFGLALDRADVLHFADMLNHRIRRINADGSIVTVAGDGRATSAGDGGPALNASINLPNGIAFDSAGNLYIAEAGGHRIRRVDASGLISTIAGTGVRGFSGDGGPSLFASMNAPRYVLAAADGQVYFTDSNNDRIRVISPSTVSFQVTPASITFSAASGGAPTADQAIQIAGDTTGLPFEIELPAPWLRSDTRSATMPATVQLIADPVGLEPGTYRAAINIAAPNANPPSRVVDVTFVVEAAVPPRLSVGTGAGLSFSFAPGARAAARQLRVLNLGGGAIDFIATASGGPWLAVTPAAGAVAPASPAILTVAANPGNLGTGTYTGRITLISAATTIDVRVTMVVSLTPATMLLSQTGLTFTAVQGGGIVPPQTIGVLNIGAGAMDWTAAVSTLTGAGWLLATPGDGTTDASSLSVPLVEVGVAHAGLAPGEYYGQVAVAAPSASNSPQVVSVVLNVLPPGSNPGPLVRPTGLIFTGVEGGATPGSQTVLISNLTAAPRVYSSGGFAFQSRNFFNYAPANATVMPDQPVRVVVQPEMEGFTAGIRRGVITLLFDDGATQTVNVLQVLAGAAGVAAKGGRAADGCTVTRLLPVFTLLPNNFVVPAAWPNPVEARVVDDCGDPLVNGAVQASFSNGDPPLSLVSLKDGRWTGTWQARNAQQAQVTVTVTAEIPGTSVRGSAQVTGGLRANPNPPRVAPGGVNPVLSPGGLLSIYGTRLAESAIAPSTLPLPTALAGTTVVLAGRALPLLYASDGQINAMAPYDLPVHTTHQLVVRKGTSYTVPEPVVLAPAQPSIFSRDQTGRGQGLAFNAVTGLMADSSAPLAPGDIVVIYAAGMGMTEPMAPAGQAAPVSPLARVTGTVRLTIGGVEAEVLFAGLAPNFTGLYQVNARVGAGTPAGDEAPVVLTVAGQESSAVTVAVR